MTGSFRVWLTCIISVFGTIAASSQKTWQLSALPASVRLDPSTNEIADIKSYEQGTKNYSADLLRKNWIFDGSAIQLYAAKGEYVSFQIVISKDSPADSIMSNIRINIDPFTRNGKPLGVQPELFLEWAVKVNTTSTGYPKSTLGAGWYPDALIPIECIQQDTLDVHGRWTYPLWLPDFNNRIEGQKSLIVWVDQFIPYDDQSDRAGNYTAKVEVTVNGETRSIPVKLNVWNFALPNANTFKASLQEEGFLSGMNAQQELEVYQLFKRNRVALMDPTYKPVLKEQGNTFSIDWKKFDDRLTKYFTGEAFTARHGYKYGPGYHEPIETFVLPFDVYGKHGTNGWPDIGTPATEKSPENTKKYISAINEVRNHLKKAVDPKKTELTVYLNGLDESYFKEAFDRMIYFGNLFKKHYPEVVFRIDGAYTKEQMDFLHGSIGAWASHTINYNPADIKKFQDKGIKDWLYGPLIYEGRVNSWVGSSTFIDHPLVNHRALSWATLKYNAYSWISWGIGYAWERAWYDPEIWKDVYKRGADSDAEFKYKKLNGNGLLVYAPGIIPNVPKVCPSIRLKAMRDGVQEYEYLRMVKDRNATIDKLVYKPFGDQSVGNLNVWEYDAEKWDRTRIEMGEKIHNTRSTSSSKP